MKVDRRDNRYLNCKSCGAGRAETEIEVVPTTRRTAGVFDQNSAVYHDAADTNPQTDVFARSAPRFDESDTSVIPTKKYTAAWSQNWSRCKEGVDLKNDDSHDPPVDTDHATWADVYRIDYFSRFSFFTIPRGRLVLQPVNTEKRSRRET